MEIYYYCVNGHARCERQQFYKGEMFKIIGESYDIGNNENGKFDFNKDIGFCYINDILRD